MIILQDLIDVLNALKATWNRNPKYARHMIGSYKDDSCFTEKPLFTLKDNQPILAVENRLIEYKKAIQNTVYAYTAVIPELEVKHKCLSTHSSMEKELQRTQITFNNNEFEFTISSSISPSNINTVTFIVENRGNIFTWFPGDLESHLVTVLSDNRNK